MTYTPYNALLLNEYVLGKVELKQSTFTQAELKEAFGVDGKTASAMIQAYLYTLVSDSENILSHVIYRAPKSRTRTAVWVIGEKTADVRRVVEQAADDFDNRTDTLAAVLGQMQFRNAPSRAAIGRALIKFDLALEQLRVVASS